MLSLDAMTVALAGVTPERPITTNDLCARLAPHEPDEKARFNFLSRAAVAYQGCRNDGPTFKQYGRERRRNLWFDPALRVNPLPPLDKSIMDAVPKPKPTVSYSDGLAEVNIRLDELFDFVRKLSVTKPAEVVIGAPLQTEADQIETLRADRNQWIETANFYKERCHELEAEIAELKGE